MVVHYAFELLEGHREELVKMIGGEDTWIEAAFAHGTKILGAPSILRRSHPFEIARAIVEFVAVDVVALEADWSRTMEGNADEDVAVLVPKLSHHGISATMRIITC